MDKLGRRRMEERVFLGLMSGSILVVVGSLLSMFLTVLGKGLGALSLAMVTQTPKGGYYLGKEGGY